MEQKHFKVCPCCGKMFDSQTELEQQTEYIGDMTPEVKCYNCSCGTTLAICTPYPAPSPGISLSA